MRIAIGGIWGVPARYGGFETSAAETATRLRGLGHNVSVYCRGKRSKDCETFHDVRLVHLRVPQVSSLETIWHSISLALHVIFVGRDVEVVHLYNAASAFGGLFLRAAGKPFVITLDGVEWKREKWNRAARLLRRIATWLATRVADVTVCDSNVVRNYFESKYDTEML